MKKNSIIENKVIVIGGDHYNALGVIRSLGECGIFPIFILLNDDDKAMSSHSKYIDKLYIINSEEEKNLDKFLIKNFGNDKNKPIIIPTGDPIEKYLDINYDKLKKYFLLPNIDNKSGMVLKHMDKLFQYELCKKNNVDIAESFYIDLTNDVDYSIFPLKVIIKPDISADGNKADIVIANGIDEIKNGIELFRKKGYKNVLVQEFLDYQMEYAMMGLSYKGKVIIPGINSNNYIFPSARGNTSYAEMFPLEEFKYDISKIINMVEKMNYTGLFEIEMFLVNDKVYFNEMNFRNSANLYGYKGNGIKYIYLYIMLLLNKDISKEKIYVDKHYHFCIEPLHFKNIFEKKVKLFPCVHHIIHSTKLIYNSHDLKPTLVKYKYAVRKRIKKGNKK